MSTQPPPSPTFWTSSLENEGGATNVYTKSTGNVILMYVYLILYACIFFFEKTLMNSVKKTMVHYEKELNMKNLNVS